MRKIVRDIALVLIDAASVALFIAGVYLLVALLTGAV